MSEPRTRLDQAMTDRGLKIKKRWVQIATEAGISTAALGAIRRGEYKPSPHTARRLEDAFQWSHGSIDAILAGGDPTPVEGERPDIDPDEAEILALNLPDEDKEFYVEQIRAIKTHARRTAERADRNHT